MQRTLKRRFTVHHREAWTDYDPTTVMVCTRYGNLKGTYQRQEKEARPFVEKYLAAKKNFDQEAADEIVSRCLTDKFLDEIIDLLDNTSKKVFLIFPHPEFTTDGDVSLPHKPTNALPFAFSSRLGEILGLEQWEDVIEYARPGRTALSGWQRLLWQPKFTGSVRHGAAYILVDDVVTNGGTLAALRSYIVQQGGTVIGAAVLSNQTVSRSLAHYRSELKAHFTSGWVMSLRMYV